MELTIDHELLEPFEHIAAPVPSEPPTVGDWKSRRADIGAFCGQLAGVAPGADTVEQADFTVLSCDGHSVPLWMYQPQRLPQVLVVHVHGGGPVAGSPDLCDHICRRHAAEVEVAVMSVGYRPVPELRFPAAVEDCVAAVVWTIAHAAERAPGARVAIMGDSAGGGLVAATTLLCRDREIGPLAAQSLVYPMVDDRTAHAEPAVWPVFVWSAAGNVTGWQAYPPVSATEPRTCPHARRQPARIHSTAFRRPTPRSDNWTWSARKR